MRRHSALFAILLLALAGCAQYSLVKSEPQDIGDAYSVDPQMTWNKWATGNGQTWIPDTAVAWTADGPDLESVIFYASLEKDARLFKAPGKQDFPSFDPGMRASDVAEFVAASFAARGNANVETEGLRPAAFGALDGFRFEFSMATEHGLEVDGMALGALEDGKLHLILYNGARLHYFPEYKDEVERIFGSVDQQT